MELALILCLLSIACAYPLPHKVYQRPRTALGALKFDPENIITVSLRRPLGLQLQENVENEARGVFVAEVNEGSAKASGKVYRGLYLLQGS